MIKVEKDFTDIPSILKSHLREEAFNHNVASSSYDDAKNRYKVRSVQNKLNDIYHLKCAYCEQKLLDAPKHIEHYRPKKTYYWLAYSWDNLLLSCGSCNSAKGDRFAIRNAQRTYAKETFTQIHNLSSSYNSTEEPMIINPEEEDVLKLIIFDKEGLLSSKDRRVQHTIEEACHLNREELVQLRMEIIQNFINRMDEHYLYFKRHKDLTRFLPDIQNFKKNCKVENSFYAFRYFVIENIELFFDENRALQKIVKGLFSKID